MKSCANKYTAPTYYRHFGSIGLDKEELLDIMVQDSERLKQNGVYYTILFKDFAIHGCQTHIASVYRNNFTPYHDHDYYEINCVFSGELLEYIDGRPCVLKSGELLLMAPNVYHVSNPYKKARCYNILLSRELFEGCAALLRTEDADNCLSEMVKNSGYFIFRNMRQKTERIILQMNDFARRGRQYCTCRIPLLECLARQLLYELCEHPYDAYARTENPLRKNTPEELIAKQILEYIRFHIDAVSLKQLSQHFGYSVSQTERLIEKYSGTTYTKLLHGYRQKTSTYLLRNTKLTVAQVAAKVGFRSPEHFCRWFKHYIGTNPANFRKINKYNPGVQLQ